MYCYWIPTRVVNLPRDGATGSIMPVCFVVKGVKLGSPRLHVPYWKVFGKDLWIRELYLIALIPNAIS